MNYDITQVDPGKKPPRLELIKWIDHSSYQEASWRDYSSYTEMTDIVVFTVGWVVFEDSDRVILLSTCARSGGKGIGDFNINKGTIKKRWRLNDPST